MNIKDIENKYIQAYDRMKDANNVLIVTHEKPDGDALSSACSISILLDNLEIKNSLFTSGPIPLFFNYLPNIKKFKNDKNFNINEFDLIIICDCGCIGRTGIADKLKNEITPNQFIIEFDHHPRVDDYANLEIRIPGESSTAEVLYRFFKINNIKINKDISNCLLTGILTDTANLLYASASEKTVKTSSELLLCGADYTKITQKTWQNKSLTSMKIWGVILDNLRVNNKYKMAFSALTYEDIQKFSWEIKNLDVFDSVTSFLSNIEGVRGIMFLREEEKGKIKGSLRTNHPDVNISDLAKQFGGGGHPKASGFEVEGSLIKTKNSWKII